MLLESLLAAGLAAGADTTLLRILATNDFHGALDPRVYGWSNGRPVGGAAALKATLDSAADRCRCLIGLGPPRFHLSGLRVLYDPAKPRGGRIVSMRTSSGASILPDRDYVLAVSDFLQGGGEGLNILRTLRSQRTGKTDLEALIAYLKSTPQPVVAPPEIRFAPVTP